MLGTNAYANIQTGKAILISRINDTLALIYGCSAMIMHYGICQSIKKAIEQDSNHQSVPENHLTNQTKRTKNSSSINTNNSDLKFSNASNSHLTSKSPKLKFPADEKR